MFQQVHALLASSSETTINTYVHASIQYRTCVCGGGTGCAPLVVGCALHCTVWITAPRRKVKLTLSTWDTLSTMKKASTECGREGTSPLWHSAGRTCFCEGNEDTSTIVCTHTDQRLNPLLFLFTRAGVAIQRRAILAASQRQRWRLYSLCTRCGAVATNGKTVITSIDTYYQLSGSQRVFSFQHALNSWYCCWNKIQWDQGRYKGRDPHSLYYYTQFRCAAVYIHTHIRTYIVMS